MNKNLIRFDLSNSLIHFFRDIDLESSNSIIFPEDIGFGNIGEGLQYSALFMMRCAIRQGRLWATWSMRNNIRTIYGPYPAVCFTEMPIAAFLESGEAREKRGEAMSPIALILPKKDMFGIGANPVIYGLDDRNYFPSVGKGGSPRIIDQSKLPINEQYRYVTYNPIAGRGIDWSHEREWRWPFKGDLSKYEKELSEYGIIESPKAIPGLDFYKEKIAGMGVVVKTLEQSNWIKHDILSLVDRGVIQKNKYKYILVIDNLPPIEKLINPPNLSEVIFNSLIDLDPFFLNNKNETIEKKFSNLVTEVETNVPNSEQGESGGCWLWILDNTSKLLRALLEQGRVIITNNGKYLVKLHEFSASRSLRQREQMTKLLCKKVEREFNAECGYFSVLNSYDPNELPFYNDDHLSNHMYYNYSQ